MKSHLNHLFSVARFSHGAEKLCKMSQLEELGGRGGPKAQRKGDAPL